MTAELVCPGCSAVSRFGSRYCGGCGAGLVRPYVEGAAAAPCAVHPENQAMTACPRCGAFSCPLCLTTTARGESLCAACAARQPAGVLAWDRREEIGTLRAFWRTSWEVIRSPVKTFEVARPTGSVGSSFLFALLAHVAGLATTGVVYAVVIAGLFFFRGGPIPRRSAELAAGSGVGIVLFFLVLLPLAAAGFLLINAVTDHAILRIAGARPREWRVTLRASALSLSPYLIGLVPVCGLYVFPWWAMALKVFAYRSFHATSLRKAAIGALLVPLLFLTVSLAAYGAFVVYGLKHMPVQP